MDWKKIFAKYMHDGTGIQNIQQTLKIQQWKKQWIWVKKPHISHIQAEFRTLKKII